MQSDQSPPYSEEDGSGGLQQKLTREIDAAGSALHDVQDAVQGKADDIVEQIKDKGSEKVEALQNTLADSLSIFVGALRAAGDHLTQSDQPAAANLVQSAVGAVEGLASSIKDKPFADVVTEVRTYGQSNPGVLLAGSVLAGLALGRFLKSSSTTSGSPSGQDISQGASHAPPPNSPAAQQTVQPQSYGEEAVDG